MPRFHGAEVVDGVVAATVSEYLVGARDGWEWFVDELLDDPGTATVGWAGRIGTLAARLHLDLAQPSSVFPDPVTVAPVTHEHRRCLDLLDAAASITTPSTSARCCAPATGWR